MIEKRLETRNHGMEIDMGLESCERVSITEKGLGLCDYEEVLEKF